MRKSELDKRKEKGSITSLHSELPHEPRNSYCQTANDTFDGGEPQLQEGCIAFASLCLLPTSAPLVRKAGTRTACKVIDAILSTFCYY